MTWDIRYINESFLIWIIPSTYLSHEVVNWVCTTGFAIFAFIGFYFKFLVFIIIILYMFTFWLTTCVLPYYYLVLIILYYACFLFDITYYLFACSCMPVLMTRLSIHALLIRIYRYTCAYPCTPLSIHHTTRWGVLTTWILMFRS